MKIGTTIVGARDIETRLAQVQRNYLRGARRAMEQGATIQLGAAKGYLRRRRTGLLGKSLGKKVVTYGNSVTSLVGPRHGFWASLQRIEQKGRRRVLIATRGLGAKTKTIKLTAAAGVTVFRKAGKNAGKRVSLNAVFYAHLVEDGSKPRRTHAGRAAGEMPRSPFLAPAQTSTRSEVQAKVASVLVESLKS